MRFRQGNAVSYSMDMKDIALNEHHHQFLADMCPKAISEVRPYFDPMIFAARLAMRADTLWDCTLRHSRMHSKELWRLLKQYLDADDAHSFFHKRHSPAMRSKLEDIKKDARPIKAQVGCGSRNCDQPKSDILCHSDCLNMTNY